MLDLVRLGADAGEELRHERERRVRVARIDLAHVVAEPGEQTGGVAHGRTCTGSLRTPSVGTFTDQPDPQPPGSRAAAADERLRRRRRGTGRLGRLPRITSYTSALSATLRVSGPTTPSAHHRCGCGAVVTRPRWGLRPNSPQNADGTRIDPPPSPPMRRAPCPVATATAEPPLEPPGERARPRG